ncbi:PDC sensor domain-containing protein, partial [Campylobacter majalis]|uniref:PDC sensor domain-containing protein n=1 Tax=Campylobacter majalis TaxID=2790656 RepID=UPI003D689916
MQKVANKMALIVLVLLTISFVTFSAISYQKSKDTILQMSKDSKEAAAIASEIFLDDFFSTTIFVVEGFESYIKENPEILHDKERFKNELAILARTSDANELFMGFEDTGEIIGAEIKQGAKPTIYSLGAKDNYNVKTRNWYNQMLSNNGALTFSDPYTTSTGKYAMSVGKAVIINGKIVGAIGADIYIDDLKEALVEIKDTQTSSVSITDIKRGLYIYNEDFKNILSKDATSIERNKALLKGYNEFGNSGFEYHINGIGDRVAACKVYEEANWLVCSANYMSDYDEILNEVLTSQLVFSI